MKKTVLDLRGAKPGELMMQIPAFDGNETWVKIESVKMAPKGQYTILLSGGLSYNVDEHTTLDVFQTPELTGKKNFDTPRLLLADAYTVGSGEFVSDECKEKSTYYITFRKKLNSIDPFVYSADNDKMLLAGGQRIIDHILRYPVTHAEIEETLAFLAHFHVTTNGLRRYSFDEKMWRRVVDEFNGYPPIEIKGLPEGSVVYPNEPAFQITNLVKDFGELAAWFESKLLQVWSTTERLTQDQHFRNKLADMVQSVELCDRTRALTVASQMIQDFGDRAGMNWLESENLGLTHLITYGGTDTCAGAYQAFKLGATVPGVSVKALAHRIVQGYEIEGDAYRAIYNASEPGDINSDVSDCYDFYTAVERDILPLALDSKSTGKNVVILSRIDSGDSEEQALWVCKLAKRYGLFEEVVYGTKTWYKGTFLRMMCSDGLDFPEMIKICEKLIEYGFIPWDFGLPFGCGGGLRNNLKRDNLSAKYALNSKGKENTPVVKFSETLGKTTLGGPFKVLRSAEALAANKTIVGINEEGEDALIVYYTGDSKTPFGIAMTENYEVIKERANREFQSMPGTLWTEDNHGYPASDAIRAKRIELLAKYAPKSHKRKENY